MVYGVRSNGVSAGCALSLGDLHEAKPLDVTPIEDLLPPLHTAHHSPTRNSQLRNYFLYEDTPLERYRWL